MDYQDLQVLIESHSERLEAAIRETGELQAAAVLFATGRYNYTAEAAEYTLDLAEALELDRVRRRREARERARLAAAAAGDERAKKELRVKAIEAELAAGGDRLTATPPDCPDAPTYGALLAEERDGLLEELYA